MGYVDKNHVAFSTPFDPDNEPNCGFTKDNVQEVIEELCAKSLNTASPGFTWGDSGTITNNTWLLNDAVPSNKAGRLVYLVDAAIKSVFIACENSATFDISVYEHSGTPPSFTLLQTFSVVGARSFSQTNLAIPVTTGKELAVRLTAGSAKNVVVGVQIQGVFV